MTSGEYFQEISSLGGSFWSIGCKKYQSSSSFTAELLIQVAIQKQCYRRIIHSKHNNYKMITDRLNLVLFPIPLPFPFKNLLQISFCLKKYSYKSVVVFCWKVNLNVTILCFHIIFYFQFLNFINQILYQLMKNSINFYQQKKTRTIQPVKKTNYINSIIYKQITTQLAQASGKIKNNRESKDTILSKDRKNKDEEKSIPSKKSSFNQLHRKSSKNDISGLDMYNLYHKLTDNFMVDTQEETRFQLEDTKHFAYQKQKKDNKEGLITNELIKKSSKFMKDAVELSQTLKIQKNNFNYLYIIGKGGFGKVWKVEHKKTKNQYAMKQMLKSIVMTKKSVQSVMNERVLLSQFTSPFIVNMHYAFHDRDTLYLVLDLMEGGDLRYHIGNRVFNEIQAKFFIACIVLGLQDLQRNNIIHRDIKPQNLVLDARGYIRITDLGIARIYKPNNSCDTSGTPGYMSPQVICRMNHSFVSDYFAVGVIAYQLMTGRRPYNGRSRNQIRDLMLAKQVQLKESQIPDDWSYEAADFINKLIKRKPQTRLGSGGISEIKNHPWLLGLNWQKLRSKDIESPFIPMMKKCNFDQDQQITIQDEQQAELIEKNSLLLRKPQFQQLFNGYYYNLKQNTSQEVNQAKDKEKKNNGQKRIISAIRKSTQQQKQTKINDLIPPKKLSLNQDKKTFNESAYQKKVSYNQGITNKRIGLSDGIAAKKKPQIHMRPQKYIKQTDNSINELMKEKKKSGQYDKTFFR